MPVSVHCLRPAPTEGAAEFLVPQVEGNGPGSRKKSMEMGREGLKGSERTPAAVTL